MTSDFYDLTSPLNNTTREDKSDMDIESDIPLCNNCENIILKPLNNLENNTKLICPQCGEIYDPHYEIIKTQDQETTLDELSSQGTLTYQKDDTIINKLSKTINHKEARMDDNLEYVTKEFEKYRQIEIIDKDTITSLNKTRRRSKVNE
jgi:hypothetical protein